MQSVSGAPVSSRALSSGTAATLVLALLTGELTLDAQSIDTTPPAVSASASPASESTVADLPRLLLADGSQLVTFPIHWDKRDWLLFGGAIVVIGVVAAFDRKILDASQGENKTADWVTARLEPFGAPESFGVPVVFYLAGAIGRRSQERQVGLDCLLATALASGLVTPVLQRIGRNRPSANLGTYDFDSGSAGHFPSGHATQAFALASVIASSYGSPWVKVSAYTVASVVAFARVRNNAHFPSDVLAGAFIGTVIGSSVVRLNRTLGRARSDTPRRAEVVLFPGFDERGPSLGLHVSF